MMNTTANRIFWIAVLVFLVAYPHLTDIYHVNMFVSFAIFALLAVSVNMLLGFTRLLSFGHAIYFGLGAYGTVLALRHIEGIPLLPAIAVGVLAAAAFALLVCPIVVRVSGSAFAMVHLAMGMLMYILALRFRHISGGEDGIGRFPIPDFNIPGILSVTMKWEAVNFYYFAMVVIVLTLFFMWHFTKTPFGQIQAGLRDNPKRIDYIGFKVPQSKAVVYVVSGACAGVAGSLYALFQGHVSPDGVFHILVSFTPIVAAVIGGLGSFFGPIIGMGLYLVAEELSLSFTDHVELIMGVLLVVMVLFAPQGLVGLAQNLYQRLFAPSVKVAKEEKAS